MATRVGSRTIAFTDGPKISSFAAAVGKKEGEGPLSTKFDFIAEDDKMNKDTWEQAESALQSKAITLALEKSHIKHKDLDAILAGDLLNQCISSFMASVESNVPYLGVYGACCTMAEALAIGACMYDSGALRRFAASASSHFCSAERQYRFPLSYGGQRTPTAQWTATAAGAAIVGDTGSIKITHAFLGQMVDMDIKDAANMGAAMAPAACHTIATMLQDLDAQPSDFDMILTGDLGNVGSELLATLCDLEGYNIRTVHRDCGMLLYSKDQDVHAGGSGCGCCASVLCGPVLREMEQGKYKRILFAPNGALMSPTSVQQGQGIAGISHAVILEG